MEAASGFGRIGLALGLRALHSATLPRAAASVAVLPVLWDRMLGGGATAPLLLSVMAPNTRPCPSASCCKEPALSLEA
eukprot:1162882-Prymnesium_polylepis.1